jgi:carboxymethylenebutenolidase
MLGGMILVESSVDLPTPTGPMRTYLYRPAPAAVAAGRRFPGVVLFSEIFQRTGPIARMAAMLAGHGLVVAVPEIFHDLEAPGTVLAYDPAGTARGNADKIGKPVSAYDADARAVVDYLLAPEAATSGHVGAIGVCIGGHLAFRAALDPRVEATACFYATDLHKGSLGQGGDDSLARARDVRGELLLVWGRQDPHVPEDGRALVRRTLVDAGTTFSWHEVNAQHAFMRDEGPRYDPALARWGYQMSLEMFQRVLAPA